MFLNVKIYAKENEEDKVLYVTFNN